MMCIDQTLCFLSVYLAGLISSLSLLRVFIHIELPDIRTISAVPDPPRQDVIQQYRLQSCSPSLQTVKRLTGLGK